MNTNLLSCEEAAQTIARVVAPHPAAAPLENLAQNRQLPGRVFARLLSPAGIPRARVLIRPIRPINPILKSNLLSG